jgi:hypothetical protein
MRAGIAALIIALCFTAPAEAHRLDAQAFLLPGKKVLVESWFSSGEAAQGAEVRVYGSGTELLAEGKLDEQGAWTFSFDHAEPMRIVVFAGAGHQKELTLNASELTDLKGTASATAVPLADHNTGTPIKDVLAGIGLLLAAAAFILSIRNSRRLREIEARDPRRTPV